MADPQGLEINGVRVSQTTRLTQDGTIDRPTVVTYYLGKHGPFTDEFPQSEGTAEAIKSAILNRQNHLRAILQLEAPAAGMSHTAA